MGTEPLISISALRFDILLLPKAPDKLFQNNLAFVQKKGAAVDADRQGQALLVVSDCLNVFCCYFFNIYLFVGLGLIQFGEPHLPGRSTRIFLTFPGKREAKYYGDKGLGTSAKSLIRGICPESELRGDESD